MLLQIANAIRLRVIKRDINTDNYKASTKIKSAILVEGFYMGVKVAFMMFYCGASAFC